MHMMLEQHILSARDGAILALTGLLIGVRFVPITVLARRGKCILTQQTNTNL